MKRIRRLRLVPVVEMLELDLQRVQRVGIEQLAQLRFAKQLAELGLIDRQRLSAPLRQRSIAIVDEVRHVAEEQRSCERRRLLRVGDDDADRPLLDLLHRRHEGRDVEDVAQHLAVGLEDDRE